MRVAASKILLLALLLLPACGKQKEGERCNPPAQNGNADCDDNLTCRLGVSQHYVCCPINATSDECRASALSDAGLAVVDLGVDDGGNTDGATVDETAATSADGATETGNGTDAGNAAETSEAATDAGTSADAPLAD